MDSEEKILRFLDEAGLEYRIFSHPRADTLEEKLKNDRAAGITATHCKNLFLVNRTKTRYYLLTMRLGKHFSTGPVSRQMASARLNFAPPEELKKRLGAVPGTVSPLELIFDPSCEIAFSVDEDLKMADYLCFHPANDEKTVVLASEVFFGAFLPKIKHAPNFVKIEEISED